jgi:hypothetical protein
MALQHIVGESEPEQGGARFIAAAQVSWVSPKDRARALTHSAMARRLSCAFPVDQPARRLRSARL